MVSTAQESGDLFLSSSSSVNYREHPSEVHARAADGGDENWWKDNDEILQFRFSRLSLYFAILKWLYSLYIIIKRSKSDTE